LRTQVYRYFGRKEPWTLKTASAPTDAAKAVGRLPFSGSALAVEEATAGTRFVLMAGKPYGETPAFNGPFVD
jgi:redox-sensitive bicupin YhaK (pirin superfamily)